MRVLNRNLVASAVLHLSLFACALFVLPNSLFLRSSHAPIAVSLTGARTTSAPRIATAQKTALHPRHLALGLPLFSAKPAAAASQGSSETQSGPGAGEASQKFAQELLTTESKVWETFDLLALKINRHLDYPGVLVDNGIRGNATFDLYFDSRGNIDESQSKTSGDSRLIRGLLVRAARKGIVDWFASDAGRLRKEQFRNQHFRADFVLAYSQTDQAELIKSSPGNYGFLRRRVSNVSCIGELSGAPVLNLACVAAGVSGALHRRFSDKYQEQFSAIKENLEYYDGLGVDGINSLLNSSS